MQARSQAWPWRMRMPESLQPCSHALRVMQPCPECPAAACHQSTVQPCACTAPSDAADMCVNQGLFTLL